MAPSSGMKINPHVRLVRQLGAGGMGSVWLAHHATLDTEVAVKFIADEALDSEAALERFRREASVAAKIKSPHVVQVSDHGVTFDGTPYIVMEYLEGESLAERLARGPLSEDQVTLLVSQVGEVLSRAHAKGIVHRDIKPGNLFLIDSGYDLFVKVLDFGIARSPLADGRAPLTQSGAMLGTPLYMSPEQIEDPRGADHRADLWALAVVLYECFTGRVPFDGENVGALCITIARGVHAPPSNLDPALAHLDGFFARALATDPEARFADATEMVAELGGTLAESRPRSSGDVASAEEALVFSPKDAPPARGSDPTTPLESHPRRATTTAAVSNTLPAAQPSRRWSWPLVAVGLVGLGAGGAWVLRGEAPAPATSATARTPSAPIESPPSPPLPDPAPPPEAQPPAPPTEAPPSPQSPAPVVAPPPSPASPAPSSSPPPPGGLSPRRQASVGVLRGKIAGCNRRAPLTGVVSVTVTVSEGGLVQSANLTGAPMSVDHFANCARVTALNTTFGRGPARTIAFSVQL